MTKERIAELRRLAEDWSRSNPFSNKPLAAKIIKECLEEIENEKANHRPGS